jgi:hypothetical protein
MVVQRRGNKKNALTNWMANLNSPDERGSSNRNTILGLENLNHRVNGGSSNYDTILRFKKHVGVATVHLSRSGLRSTGVEKTMSNDRSANRNHCESDGGSSNHDTTATWVREIGNEETTREREEVLNDRAANFNRHVNERGRSNRNTVLR